VKKEYRSPRLSVYGGLQEITLGGGGNAPDCPPVFNNNLFTTQVGTVIITCATIPVS
jgi:hypothetical protein